MKNLKRFLYTFWIKKTQKLSMAPDTKLLKKGGKKAVSSVVRALLAKSSFILYDFVVRAVLKITEDERLHLLHFHKNYCTC